MYYLSNFVKVQIPNYLSGLPIPDSIGGWFNLGLRDWAALIPPTVVIGGISYYSYHTIRSKGHINKSIKKDLSKVVDFVEIEDIQDKAVLCRCWKSKNWPYCDGSHAAHNEATGDNTGPVIIKHKDRITI